MVFVLIFVIRAFWYSPLTIAISMYRSAFLHALIFTTIIFLSFKKTVKKHVFQIVHHMRISFIRTSTEMLTFKIFVRQTQKRKSLVDKSTKPNRLRSTIVEKRSSSAELSILINTSNEAMVIEKVMPLNSTNRDIDLVVDTTQEYGTWWQPQ